MQEKQKIIIDLSDDILSDFELNRIPFQQILMKCARLARIIGNIEFIDLISMELNGYEYDKKGNLTKKSWSCGNLAGRTYYEKDKNGDMQYYMRAVPVATLEATINNYDTNILAAKDVNVSISSNSNINPYIHSNAAERKSIKDTYNLFLPILEKVKGNIYNYVINLNYKYKFEEKMISIFERKQQITNEKLLAICPDFSKQLISVYNNIESINDEDWSNAVHTCRRILKTVADSLYPPKENQLETEKIKLGEENYINRIIAYINDNLKSKSSKRIIGCSLEFIGNYIDSIYEFSNKGTHNTVTKDEAERCIIYTYVLLSDILSLK